MKKKIVDLILSKTPNAKKINYQKTGCGFAPTNIALCKYWGKRNTELNLPVTSSLSISLGKKGTFTTIKHIKSNYDIYFCNNKKINLADPFAIRLKNFLDLFRPNKNIHYQIKTTTDLPIAAGLASSASGFAALVLALNDLYDWNLAKKELSILARLGSGSATRSLYNGFVEWQAGTKNNGINSFAKKFNYQWPELRIGILIISPDKKIISSTEAMQNTLQTSILYQSWKKQVAIDLSIIKEAIQTKDFKLFGETIEANALAMHATMLSAKPAIIYFTPKTLATILVIQQLRKSGIKLYFTEDAGPNLKLFFLAKDQKIIQKKFPELEIIAPFEDSSEVILVDEHDKPTCTEDKISAHVCAKLHRAFSIFILHKTKNKIELLLQQRANNKYHSANLWANTCCGHPQPHENTINAAQNRLQEEMGLFCKLKPIGNFRYKMHVTTINKKFLMTEHEFDHVLSGNCQKKSIKINQNEVQRYKWVELNHLQKDLAANPQKYVVWLPNALNVLLDSIDHG